MLDCWLCRCLRPAEVYNPSQMTLPPKAMFPSLLESAFFSEPNYLQSRPRFTLSLVFLGKKAVSIYSTYLFLQILQDGSERSHFRSPHECESESYPPYLDRHHLSNRPSRSAYVSSNFSLNPIASFKSLKEGGRPRGGHLQV
jgi:hypothetical protein